MKLAMNYLFRLDAPTIIFDRIHAKQIEAGSEKTRPQLLVGRKTSRFRRKERGDDGGPVAGPTVRQLTCQHSTRQCL